MTIREAICHKCGEMFVPAYDDDLIHGVKENGDPCSGQGEMVFNAVARPI